MQNAPRNTLLRHIRNLLGNRPGGLTDAQLLDRFARHGHEAAFETLVWRHGSLVLNVCQRLLPTPQDAEDAFQATFLVLASKGGTLRQPERLAAWLGSPGTSPARRGPRQPVALTPGEYRVTVSTEGLKEIKSPRYVAIPVKYSKPETSGLKIKVKKGKQTIDIELK